MSTRSQKKANKAIITTPTKKRIESSWILFAKETLLENNSFPILTLPHPAHGKPAKFSLDESHKKMFEVVTFSEPYRSWFIGESVKSDGSIQMLTPINPVFLVLPKLIEQCTNRAVPLEDLLSEKGFDKILDIINNLDCVADMKGPADIKAYKYNEEKALQWLESRVRKVATVLRNKNIHVTSGAVSVTFVTSNVGNENIDEEFYLKYAFGIISEYIQEDLANKLEKKFNFKPEVIESIGNKRKSEVMEKENNKKMKHNTSSELDSSLTDISEFKASEIKKQKPLTAKEKARQKAASGTKTISSFFSKK